MTILTFHRRFTSKLSGKPPRSRVAAPLRRHSLSIEQLEPRCLLSAQAGGFFHPIFVLHRSGNSLPSISASPIGYTPTQIRHAYGFDQVMFGSVQGNGAGQTIAVIDAYDSPTIASDLHAFDVAFGIPDPPSFTRVAQNGSTNYPSTDPAGAGNPNGTWEMETALDVESAHARRPARRSCSSKPATPRTRT